MGLFRAGARFMSESASAAVGEVKRGAELGMRRCGGCLRRRCCRWGWCWRRALAGRCAGVAQGGGVQIHPNALELKFSKLNPVTNLGNLFSLRSAARMVKSLVPAAVMVALGWGALKALMLPMPVMSLMRLPATFSTAYGLALDAAWVTLAWSGLDYAIEWRSWNERLKMSKQEMRDEMRDAMGNPQMKAKIRQIQMAMRKRKVKADMSRASVVITNPTHYAVALEFSFETMEAPTVLAKGRDLHAAEIREEARWAGVPMIENPPLARSLYRMVEPGQSIPFELYAAVAGILAYLYRQKVEERMRRERQAQQAGRVSGSMDGSDGRDARLRRWDVSERRDEEGGFSIVEAASVWCCRWRRSAWCS